MKKKPLIIMSVVVLLSLLIPVPQKPFMFILGTFVLATVAFLLYSLISKKIFTGAPILFKILLLLIIILELQFTKDFIFMKNGNNFGYWLGKFNYIIEFVILGVLFLFNLFFIVNFICKLTIEKDPYSEMNSKMFEIESNRALTTEEQAKEKQKLMKQADYYTELAQAHKKLLLILIIAGAFTIIQIAICFMKHGIILEPTIGTAVGFSFIILISITLLEIIVFTASRKKTVN